MVSLDGGWVFDKNFCGQSVDLNKYIGIQDAIIVIIGLIFSDLLVCCCLRIAARRERLGQRGGGRVAGRGKCQNIFRIKSVA